MPGSEKILLLGKNGQLGWELQRTLAPLGQVISLDLPEINLVDPDSIVSVARKIEPQVIVNATAYTAVDRAESEPEIASAVNAQSPGMLAEVSNEIHAGLIHFSTNYVFNGEKGSPYTEADTPDPKNVYGKSKLAGEIAIQQTDASYMIFRTSWVYSLRGNNFVSKVLGWARKQSSLRIVSDQIANPTWARMLAEVTAQVLAKAGPDALSWIENHKGVYHLAGSGTASRYDWAREILKHDPLKNEQVVEELLPAKTTDFPSPAKRPLNSSLNCEHFINTFGLKLPSWQDCLHLAMVTN